MAVTDDSESQATLLLGNEFSPCIHWLVRWLDHTADLKGFSSDETSRHRQESSHGFLILQPVTESPHRLRCVIYLFEGAQLGGASFATALGKQSSRDSKLGGTINNLS
jgi:hypothetical protein